jgi:hypothetical protein
MNSRLVRSLMFAAMIGALSSVGDESATRMDAGLAQARLADAGSTVGTEGQPTTPPGPVAHRRPRCGGPAIKPLIRLMCSSGAATAGSGSAHRHDGRVRLVVAVNPCLKLLLGSVG